MKRIYKVDYVAKKFHHAGPAMKYAEKKHPGIVWGEWHQGYEGGMCIVGKLPNGIDTITVRQVFVAK